MSARAPDTWVKLLRDMVFVAWCVAVFCGAGNYTFTKVARYVEQHEHACSMLPAPSGSEP